MKIAIHPVPGSFSDRWITYCKSNKIPYKLVNCYENNILEQLNDCDALMWHFHHAGSKSMLMAKQLLYSVKASGKLVFPDFDTVWHFDDKVGQKYLLKAIDAPLVPSHVFYTKNEAIEWTKKTSFPKVFKLRGGAGSVNVKIVKTRSHAVRLIKQAFGSGFKHDSLIPVAEVFDKYRQGKASFISVLKMLLRPMKPTAFAKVHGREKGYVYFQDFIANNDSDVRVIVIDEKAFAIKRMVRKNDFRASGSGEIYYEKALFDLETIKLSFDIASKLHTQCVALDFVYQNAKPLVVEISFGFSVAGYDPCVGYWSSDMAWHEGAFNPQGWMVESIIKSIADPK